MRTQIEVIHRAIEFIESQLQFRITVAQIAEHSGYSLFYFIRTFNKVTHQTPYDYLITRRLSEALRELLETDRRITDIAMDFCFDTPESFSRAFKRLFGVLPSSCRKGKLPESVFSFPPKTMPDLQFIDRSDFIPPEIVECEGRAICGLSTEFDTDDGAGYLDQEERTQKQVAACLKGRKVKILAVRSYSDKRWQHGYLFKGFIVEKEEEIIPPLSVQQIPSGQYAKMVCVASDRQAALNYILYTWLLKTGYKSQHRFLVEETRGGTDSNIFSSIRIPVVFL